VYKVESVPSKRN